MFSDLAAAAPSPPPPARRRPAGDYELYSLRPGAPRRRQWNEPPDELWRPPQTLHFAPAAPPPPAPPPRCIPANRDLRRLYGAQHAPLPKPGGVLLQPQRPPPTLPEGEAWKRYADLSLDGPTTAPRWQRYVRGMLAEYARMRRTLPYGDGGTEELIVEFAKRPGWNLDERDAFVAAGVATELTDHLKAAAAEGEARCSIRQRPEHQTMSGAALLCTALGCRTAGFLLTSWPPSEQRVLDLLREAVLREGPQGCGTVTWQCEREEPDPGGGPTEWVRESVAAASLHSEGYDITFRLLLRSTRGPGLPAVRWRTGRPPLLSAA